MSPPTTWKTENRAGRFKPVGFRFLIPANLPFFEFGVRVQPFHELGIAPDEGIAWTGVAFASELVQFRVRCLVRKRSLQLGVPPPIGSIFRREARSPAEIHVVALIRTGDHLDIAIGFLGQIARQDEADAVRVADYCSWNTLRWAVTGLLSLTSSYGRYRQAKSEQGG